MAVQQRVEHRSRSCPPSLPHPPIGTIEISKRGSDIWNPFLLLFKWNGKRERERERERVAGRQNLSIVRKSGEGGENCTVRRQSNDIYIYGHIVPLIQNEWLPSYADEILSYLMN